MRTPIAEASIRSASAIRSGMGELPPILAGYRDGTEGAVILYTDALVLFDDSPAVLRIRERDIEVPAVRLIRLRVTTRWNRDGPRPRENGRVRELCHVVVAAVA